MSATFEDRIGTNPWGLVAESLLHQAKGEPVPEDLQEATTAAAVVLTALALREGGATDELLEELFDERDFDVKLSYKDDAYGIEISWPDGGEQVAVTGRSQHPISKASESVSTEGDE